MYGKIYPISELPKDAIIQGGRDYTHFFTVKLFGTTYYIPIRKGSKTVIEKLGISKTEDFVQDIIASVKLQVRNDIAESIHRDLCQQISNGLAKLYDQNLFNAITNQMDNKIALKENNDDKQRSDK